MKEGTNRIHESMLHDSQHEKLLHDDEDAPINHKISDDAVVVFISGDDSEMTQDELPRLRLQGGSLWTMVMVHDP